MAFPDTITAHDYKVHLVADFDALHIWERSDRLLLQRQIMVLLVDKIANRPRQIQISIDPSLRINVRAGLSDPQALAWVCRLVVDTQRLSTALDAGDGAGVAGVGDVEGGLVLVHGTLIVRYHEYDVGCAAF